jgi:hypothetical protein
LNAAVNLVENGQKDIAIATDQWGGGTSANTGADKQTYYKLSLSGDVADSPREMADDLYKGGCMHGAIALCEAQNCVQAFFHLVSLGVASRRIGTMPLSVTRQITIPMQGQPRRPFNCPAHISSPRQGIHG